MDIRGREKILSILLFFLSYKSPEQELNNCDCYPCHPRILLLLLLGTIRPRWNLNILYLLVNIEYGISKCFQRTIKLSWRQKYFITKLKDKVKQQQTGKGIWKQTPFKSINRYTFIKRVSCLLWLKENAKCILFSVNLKILLNIFNCFITKESMLDLGGIYSTLPFLAFHIP